VDLLRDAADRSNLRFDFAVWDPSSSLPAGAIAVLPIDAPPSPVDYGEVRKEYGEFARKAVVAAVDLVQNHHADAIVTAPLCKQSLQMAGCPHHGHTELLAELAGAKRVVMMLANPKMKVALVTTHLPLKEVPEKITKDSVLETIEITRTSFERFGWGSPRMGVLGLNPHAGEEGTLGTEDTTEIAPAIEVAKDRGCDCVGPLPADTAFHRALDGEFDVIVAMYHDQGLGPLKTISFEDVINVTLGLPFVRVSPGHGTAFNIAGKNLADPTSMKAALEAAADMIALREAG